MIRHPLGDVFPFWAVLFAGLGGLLAAVYVVVAVRVASRCRAAGVSRGWALLWPLAWLVPTLPPRSRSGSEDPPAGGTR